MLTHMLSCICMLRASDMHPNIFLLIVIKNQKKKTELNELKYSKAPLQMSSYAHIHVPLDLHAQTCINVFFYQLNFKIEKNDRDRDK